MTARWLLTILALITSYCGLAEGQELAVRYFPEKSDSPLREPVFVIAELTNRAAHTVRFDESPCLQSFRPVIPVEPAKNTNLYGCAGGGTAGSCAGEFVELKPGEKLSQRYLLPDGIAPNSLGYFEYEAQREISFYSADHSDREVQKQEVNETFTVHAVEVNENQLRADYAPLVADVQSPDACRRSIAVNALTEHPPEFLEPVILQLSQNPATMRASIEGLKKLGTNSAKHRLAELTDSQYDESMRQPAATALAELGDRNYCGVMLQLMNLHQGYTAEIAARGAGLLCGDTAIPQLVLLLSAGPGQIPQYEVAYALGNTASRSALPVLIEMLRNSDANSAAKEALYTLTHRQSGVESLLDEYREWTNWWALQGRTARIFSPAECP